MSSRDALSESFLNSDTISDDFFIQIVENKLNIKRDEFKLRLVILNPATGKNENYTSVLYRARIKIQFNDGRKETVQVIIKALLLNIPELKEFGVFCRERKVYELIVPSFENLWKDAGIDVQFGPKSIKFETEPYEIIILDDLHNYNYVMADRKVGLDLTHAKLILSKLAKFHAAGAVRHEKEGTITNELDRIKSMPKFDPNQPNPMVDSLLKICKTFKDKVKSWPGYEELYGETLDRWNDANTLSCFIEVAIPMKSGFTVLNHGDLWINNFMFEYDGDMNPTECVFIDFQGSFWGSPSGDLMYFFISSIADNIKVDNFDSLIEFYHEELVKGLKCLGYSKPIPTLSDIHIDILEKGSFANICLMFILFVVKYDSNEEISMEDLMRGGEGQDQLLDRLYSIENYTNAIKILLPFLKKRGFLDAMTKPSPNLLGDMEMPTKPAESA